MSHSDEKNVESHSVVENLEQQHSKEFSEEGFWNKATNYAKKAGKKVIEPSLKMYYAAQDQDTPVWAKGIIYGALGYFILPIDAVPDVAPVVGYTDDFATLAAALAAVATNIKDEHVEKAKEKMREWFN